MLVLVSSLFITIPPLRSLWSATLSSTSRALPRAALLASHISPFFTFAKTGASNSHPTLEPQPINNMSQEEREKLQTATLACGCFWSVELIYQREEGVIDTEVGYTGGQVENPSYEAVCSGRTGHAESVKIRYDPTKTSYQRLLDIFFHKHDPTQKDRQGNDRGTQYRSAIFYHNEEQKKVAEETIAKEQTRFKSPIVTQLVKAPVWYPAEAYHQRYLEKGGQCAAKGDTSFIRCYG